MLVTLESLSAFGPTLCLTIASGKGEVKSEDIQLGFDVTIPW